MIDDSERRDVAAKLRFNACTALHMNTSYDFAREVFRAAMNEEVVDYRAAIKRLADLMEPRCDRDVLLEEVNELEKCAYYFGLDFDEDEPLRDRLKEAAEDFAGCASRIREALGVER